MRRLSWAALRPTLQRSTRCAPHARLGRRPAPLDGRETRHDAGATRSVSGAGGDPGGTAPRGAGPDASAGDALARTGARAERDADAALDAAARASASAAGRATVPGPAGAGRA